MARGHLEALLLAGMSLLPACSTPSPQQQPPSVHKPVTQRDTKEKAATLAHYVQEQRYREGVQNNSVGGGECSWESMVIGDNRYVLEVLETERTWPEEKDVYVLTIWVIPPDENKTYTLSDIDADGELDHGTLGNNDYELFSKALGVGLELGKTLQSRYESELDTLLDFYERH